MGKRSIPGSIYVPRKSGKLHIKYKGKVISTGLANTHANKRIAENMLRKMVYENLGVETIKQKNLADAVEKYERSLVRVNEKTRVNYLLAIKRVFPDISMPLTHENIEDAVIRFMDEKVGSTTKGTYLRAVQIFLNYCSRMTYISPFDITMYIPPVETQIAKSYSDEEVQKLLDHLANNELGRLIEFMVATGARVVDSLTLTWEQVDFDMKRVYWKNKIDKKEELRPISDRAIEILLIQKELSKKKVFTWSYNSTSRLDRRLKKAMLESGVEPAGRSFQEFRVTFRMRLLGRGVPEVYTQWLLRHRTFKVTGDFYTNFKLEEAKKFINL